MILGKRYAVLLIVVSTATSATAQTIFESSPSAGRPAPRLVKIMTAAQVEHLKLWFAGKSKNWDLAKYELRQLTDSLAEAAIMYPGIPVSNVTTMQKPLSSIAEAIMETDERKFSVAMSALTNGCNACHVSMDRGFIAIGLPTNQAPPANQIFSAKTAGKNK